MPKLNLFTANILKPIPFKDADGKEDGRIEYVEFVLDPNDDHFEVVGTRNNFDNANGKAAISAYADFLSHGRYDHPLTDLENGTVFVRSDADLKAFYQSDVGYVTTDCQLPGFPKVTEAKYPNGVAWLHRRRGRFIAGPLSRDGEIPQARHADWLMAAVVGYNLRVRTLPFQPWIVKVLENLSIDDHKERLAGRDAAYTTAVERKNVRKNVGKQAGRGTEAPQGAIVVKVWSSKGETVDVNELRPQVVRVHDNRGGFWNTTWDGGYMSRLEMAEIASHNGWSIELDPEL